MNVCSRPKATDSIPRANRSASIGSGSPRSAAPLASNAASSALTGTSLAGVLRPFTGVAHEEEIELLGEQ